MEDQFTYDLETELSAPAGGVLESIRVRVEIEPASAGCLIYGQDANHDFACLQVQGPIAEVDLPYRHPKIYVKYLLGLTSLKIYTLGFTDSR